MKTTYKIYKVVNTCKILGPYEPMTQIAKHDRVLVELKLQDKENSFNWVEQATDYIKLILLKEETNLEYTILKTYSYD